MESFEGSRVVREDRSVNKKMKELRTAIEINASAETVWAILTDLRPLATCAGTQPGHGLRVEKETNLSCHS